MPTDGKMLAEVTFGKHKSTDEFIVLDELYPNVLIGLNCFCNNKCEVDIENKILKIKIRYQAETADSPYEGDCSEPPTNDKACVLQTEDKIEEPDVSKELLEKDNGDVNEMVEPAAKYLQDRQKKEKLSNLIGNVFALAKYPLGTGVGTEHFRDKNDNPPFKIAPYKDPS